VWTSDAERPALDGALSALRRQRPDLRLWRSRKYRHALGPAVVARVGAARRWLEGGGALAYVVDRASRSPFSSIAALHRETGAPLLTVTPDVESAGRGASRVDPVRISSSVRLHGAPALPAPRRYRELVGWHARALSSRVEGRRRTLPQDPMAAPTDAEALRAERARLDDGEILLRQGPFTVAAARAERIPAILREIGRLREETFRAVGEGTSHSIDLDRYDQYYLHLFVWDEARERVAGAYRLGRTDELVTDRSRRRLYTASLFDFAPGFFDRLGPALELGRSFVCVEYQRSRALLLLWKGIGRLVARERRYRTLFGPVSVSSEYTPFSRELMAGVLEAERHRHPLAELVRPRCPVGRRLLVGTGLGDPSVSLADPAELSGVVSSAEVDGKGLPTLFGEYLRLGGRFLGFNVDEQFGSVMDGLVVVDLPRTSPRLLEFYLGRETAQTLLGGWRASELLD
jgi:putative hemolysin